MTLEITKSADPIEVGGELTYTIHAINQGDGAANNVGVTLLVPEEMAIVKEKLESGARVEGHTVVFERPALAAKSTASFVLTVEARRPGDVRLTAKLTCDQLRRGGPLTREETTTIVGDAPGK